MRTLTDKHDNLTNLSHAIYTTSGTHTTIKDRIRELKHIIT